MDVRTLQDRGKIDVLSDLIDKEMRQKEPASAIILIAPWSASETDPSVQTDPQHADGSRWFYLEYGSPMQLPIGPDPLPVFLPPVLAEPPPNALEQFFRRIKGETLPVHSPHELADALRRMASEINMVKTPE